MELLQYQGLFGRVAFLKSLCSFEDSLGPTRRSGSRGFANHELRLDRNLLHIGSSAFDSVDKRLRCNLSHPEEWLTYRRQSGIGERCTRNVIEAHDGNI